MEMITYLKRRFSSGDLQGEAADKREQEGLPGFLRFGSTVNAPSQTPTHSTTNQSIQSQQYSQRRHDSQFGGLQQQREGQPTMPGQGVSVSGQVSTVQGKEDAGSMYRRKRVEYPSAPTSPTRGRSMTTAFMGPVSNVTGQSASTLMRGLSSVASTPGATVEKASTIKEKQKVVLVIDDSQTDWYKYFKGRKISGDWDIRVEQAEFSQISMTAYGDLGCVVNTYQRPSETRSIRSFKPDFVLIRQHVSESNADWQPILTGLMYGGTPCMNPLHALYNMKNKPWLFAHLLLLRNRLGKELFPLINQVYHTNHKEMITAPAFPTIIKIGHGHRGEGKIRVDNPISYHDVTSLLIANNTYATTEPFIDAMCDVHVQKIGSRYRAFVRKSLSGQWKTNTGSAIIEKVPLSDMFRQWVDEVSRMFGGLDICSVEALQSRNGEYFIYEVNGSDMPLFGDSQEEDRRDIAELVYQRMQTACSQEAITKAANPQAVQTPVTSERFTKVPMTSVLTHTPMTAAGRVSPASNTTTHSPARQPLRQSAQQIPQQQHSQALNQFQAATTYTSQQQSYAKPQTTGVPAMSQPQYQPQHPQGPQYQAPTVGKPDSMKQHSPYQELNSGQSAYSSGASSAPSVGANWGEQSSVSSVGSFVGSVSSTQIASGTTKQDSYHPSGHNPAIGSTTVEPQMTTHQPIFDAAYPPRQSPFSQTSRFDSSESTWTSSGYAGSGYTGSGQEADRSTEGYGSRMERPYESNGYFEKPHDRTFESTSQRGQVQSSGASSAQEHTFQGNRSGGVGSSTSSDQQNIPSRQASLRSGEETDDTMRNLRKTFAGIFGDM